MKAHYGRLPDIDILPEQYRWRLITRVQALLVLVLVLAAVGGYSVYQGRAAGQQDLNALRDELRSLARATEALAPQVRQADTLRRETAALRTEAQKVKGARGVYDKQRLEWAKVMQPVFLAPPPGIELKSVVKEAGLLTIEGASTGGFPAIARYHDLLAAIPEVNFVDINKVGLVKDPKSGEYIYFHMELTLRGE